MPRPRKRQRNVRRRRGPNRFRAVNYAYSTRPQCLGPGVASNCVTGTKNLNNAQSNASFSLSLAQSTEFLTMVYRYKYFKLLSCSVIFEPVNFSNILFNIHFEVDWDGSSIMQSNLDQYADSVKVASSYLTRRRTFKFIPPNINITYTPSEGVTKVINWRDWQSTDLLVSASSSSNILPGQIRFKPDAIGAYTTFVRIEFRVIYKGVRPFQLSSASKLLNELTEIENKKQKAAEERKVLERSNRIEALKEEICLRKEAELLIAKERLQEQKEID